MIELPRRSAIEILPWDSRFFGCRIAKYKSTALTPTLAQTAIKLCLARRVKCLYYLASSNDSASIACAETHDFHLVDIRVTLNRDVNLSIAHRKALPQALTFRSANRTDTSQLQRLARSLFPNSRFAVDPGFLPDAHEKLFSTWIAKSVEGHFDDWVGIAECRGRLAGFISCRRAQRSSGAIGLIGVAPAFRRRGIGQALIHQGLDWFRKHSIRSVSVVTQGRALSAQRLYQICGFRTGQVDLWYHKWF
jgi:ribosomal protein S18 acetylase RimI-like enzyme